MTNSTDHTETVGDLGSKRVLGRRCLVVSPLVDR
jgi:hypothetical protein